MRLHDFVLHFSLKVRGTPGSVRLLRASPTAPEIYLLVCARFSLRSLCGADEMNAFTALVLAGGAVALSTLFSVVYSCANSEGSHAACFTESLSALIGTVDKVSGEIKSKSSPKCNCSAWPTLPIRPSTIRSTTSLATSLASPTPSLAALAT